MVFASSDMIDDRLLSVKGKTSAVTRWIAYAHGIVTDILASYDISASSITESTDNYLMLYHAEADIAAGYMRQDSQPIQVQGSGDETRTHIMVTSGMNNVHRWAKTYSDSNSTDDNPRLRMTKRKMRKDYSDYYS